MQEALRFTGKLISATVSRMADRWFISITVAADAIPLRPAENQGATGPHTDSQRLAVAHIGKCEKGQSPTVQAPCPYCQHPAGRLAQSQVRSYATVSPHRYRGAERARDVEKPSTGPIHCRYMNFFEFRRQLEYKAERRGGLVLVAGRWFPSSKSCSAWGTVQETLPLAICQWVCPECGSIHGREVNAARNILAHGLAVLNSPMASSAKCEAGGEKNSSRCRMTMGKTVLCEAKS